MSAILKIGYHHFLVNNDAEALKVVQILSKAPHIRDHTYRDEIAIEKDQLDIEMSIVRKKCRIVDAETGQPVELKPTSTRKLKPQHVLELGWHNDPKVR